MKVTKGIGQTAYHRPSGVAPTDVPGLFLLAPDAILGIEPHGPAGSMAE